MLGRSHAQDRDAVQGLGSLCKRSNSHNLWKRDELDEINRCIEWMNVSKRIWLTAVHALALSIKE